MGDSHPVMCCRPPVASGTDHDKRAENTFSGSQKEEEGAWLHLKPQLLSVKFAKSRSLVQGIVQTRSFQLARGCWQLLPHPERHTL